MAGTMHTERNRGGGEETQEHALCVMMINLERERERESACNVYVFIYA